MYIMTNPFDYPPVRLVPYKKQISNNVPTSGNTVKNISVESIIKSAPKADMNRGISTPAQTASYSSFTTTSVPPTKQVPRQVTRAKPQVKSVSSKYIFSPPKNPFNPNTKLILTKPDLRSNNNVSNNNIPKTTKPVFKKSNVASTKPGKGMNKLTSSSQLGGKESPIDLDSPLRKDNNDKDSNCTFSTFTYVLFILLLILIFFFLGLMVGRYLMNRDKKREEEEEEKKEEKQDTAPKSNEAMQNIDSVSN